MPRQTERDFPFDYLLSCPFNKKMTKFILAVAFFVLAFDCAIGQFNKGQCDIVWDFCSTRRNTIANETVTMTHISTIHKFISPMVRPDICTQWPYNRIVLDYCAGAEKLARCTDKNSDGSCQFWFTSNPVLFQTATTCVAACRMGCINCPNTLKKWL